MVGFAITIWQLSNVKTVASAQKDAIASLKLRLSQLDIITECTKADAALVDIKRELLSSDKAVSIDSLDRLATAFVSIREGSSSMSAELSARVEAAISDINKLADTSPRLISEPSSTIKQMASVRDFHGLIIKIRAQAQEESPA